MVDQLAFPEPADLETDHIGDNKPVVFQKYTLANPHPGYGKNSNILNEYGHTRYPKWVKNAAGESVIVNNVKEEAAIVPSSEAKASVPAVATPTPVNSEVEALKAELAALKASLVDKNEAVKLRDDGPTIHQWLAAGFKAVNYPPAGYASKSDEEEVEAAIAEEEAAEADAKAEGWASKTPPAETK